MSSRKKNLIDRVVEELNRELDVLSASAKSAHEAATHEESRAEDEHDTRGLEASYLAGAQMARMESLKKVIAAYGASEFRDFKATDPIDVGALVELETEGRKLLCFIVGQGGGKTISFEGRSVQVITPQSPLGEALLGKRLGDAIEVESQRLSREYEILSIE